MDTLRIYKDRESLSKKIFFFFKFSSIQLNNLVLEFKASNFSDSSLVVGSKRRLKGGKSAEEETWEREVTGIHDLASSPLILFAQVLALT